MKNLHAVSTRVTFVFDLCKHKTWIDLGSANFRTTLIQSEKKKHLIVFKWCHMYEFSFFASNLATIYSATSFPPFTFQRAGRVMYRVCVRFRRLRRPFDWNTYYRMRIILETVLSWFLVSSVRNPVCSRKNSGFHSYFWVLKEII